MILGVLFVSILGTVSHFVYEWTGNNVIVGLFSPINESTWEHAKLLFFPMLIFYFFGTRKTKAYYPCLFSSMAFGIVLGTLLIPILFYTYTGVLGFNIAAIDVSIFFISVIVAFYLSYRLALSCNAEKYKGLLMVLLIVLTALFFFFTFLPPDIPLFLSP